MLGEGHPVSCILYLASIQIFRGGEKQKFQLKSDNFKSGLDIVVKQSPGVAAISVIS